jgi:hypothetical protein
LGDHISSVKQETHGRDTEIIQIFGWKKQREEATWEVRTYYLREMVCVCSLDLPSYETFTIKDSWV